MCKIISIANQKGGVGKTTTSVNLAVALAKAGKRILLVDLDPQSNTTTSIGVIRSELVYSIYDTFANNVYINDVIVKSSTEGLDVLPATVDLASVDLKLRNVDDKEYILHRAFNDCVDKYDYILIDCPPSLGLLTINAMLASHSVLIPVQCEFFAMDGLTQLMNTLRIIQKKQRENGRTLEIEGILLTMLDNRHNFGYEIVSDVRTYFKEKVFNAVIPRNVHTQIAPSHRQSVIDYAPTSSGAIMYQKLAKEVISRNE